MTDYRIDSLSYYKPARHPVGYGYELRPSGARVQSIILHSTNGNVGSSFSAEANFLADSPDVSAHYLISKDGRIACIVPPSMRAWHSGNVYPVIFNNDTSLGIETHYTPGENWTQAGQDALTWLVKSLIQQYGILRQNIETHRKVAMPVGRKLDPSQLSDSAFYAWRDSLFTPQRLRKFVVNTTGTIYIRQGPGKSYPVAGTLHQGDEIIVDKVIAGQLIDGNDQWAHVDKSDPKYGDAGFITMTVLKEVVS
jgi:hypothetical protein